MNFNITYDPATINAVTLGGAPNLAAFEGQIEAVAALYRATFLDPVTVNITVEFGSVSLAQTSQAFYPTSAATVQDALRKDATSTDDVITANAFSAAGTIYLTQAQRKALGIIPPDAAGSDATVTFSNTPGLLDFTHSDSMARTSYDLFGAAAHEISEAMGRLIDPQSADGTSLPTVLGRFDVGGNFTIGSEALLKFNTAPTGDRGDWDNSVAADDAFRASGAPGTVEFVSATDLRALDVVGWNDAGIPAGSGNFVVTNTTKGQTTTMPGTAYTGPVTGIRTQFIEITSDSLNITPSGPDSFVHSGGGDDAIDVSAVNGTNVLDGGGGSNFLTGGSGADTFFVDNRAAAADIWSTVNKFQSGDAATIWGINPTNFDIAWTDGQGADGFTGLTLHATASGRSTASLTLAGYSSADLSDGRLSVTFGSVDSNAYMYVQSHG